MTALVGESMPELVLALFLQAFGFSVSRLLVTAVDYVFYILLGFIIAWILFSWFPGYPSNRFFQVVYDAVGAVVNPIMMPLRSRLPTLQLGGFALDLSPIVAIFGLYIGRSLLTLIIANFIRPVTG
ncbi:MAG: YggT family protein [Actinobacteria bacterium]|nr:YggT family protein [Actinomycetota bacterium]MCA1739590.1 YggT family protein [Actinomycetota bacterium]